MTPAERAALELVLSYIEMSISPGWANRARDLLWAMAAERAAARVTAERDEMEAHR